MACSKCRVGFERGKGMECGGIYCAIDAAALFACKTGASVVAAPHGWQAPRRSRGAEATAGSFPGAASSSTLLCSSFMREGVMARGYRREGARAAGVGYHS